MTSSACDIGTVSEFAPGTPYCIEVAGRRLVVVRNGDRFYALRDTCPHQGAPLSAGSVQGTTLKRDVGDPIAFGRVGEILRCPWHGWEFDLKTGRSLIDPDKIRVRAYPVRVEGDRVIVEIAAHAEF